MSGKEKEKSLYTFVFKLGGLSIRKRSWLVKHKKQRALNKNACRNWGFSLIHWVIYISLSTLQHPNAMPKELLHGLIKNLVFETYLILVNLELNLNQLLYLPYCWFYPILNETLIYMYHYDWVILYTDIFQFGLSWYLYHPSRLL